MSDALIKRIISMSCEGRNVNISKMNRLWRAMQIDKRYKLFWLAATTPCNSGIIQFHGQKYYFFVEANGNITLEHSI